MRSDEPTSSVFRPSHGLAAYVKHGIHIKEVQRFHAVGFESLYMCLHRPGQQKPVQFIAVYTSPRTKFRMVTQSIDEVMLTVDLISAKCLIMGDLNMNSILPGKQNPNSKIMMHMNQEYNMKQYVHETTHEKGSVLDLCFSSENNVNCIVTWNHWSDHKIVSAVLP